MASHFRWYGSETDQTVPFNRTYSYPSEANAAVKSIVKISPKNKDTYYPNSGEIKIELPADGFLNPASTFLEFDVTLTYTPATVDPAIIRFQNGIQSIFSKFRYTYGSSNFEEIDKYNYLARIFTDHAGTGQTGGIDQMSITEGIGKAAWGVSGQNADAASITIVPKQGMVNARQAYIQGISNQVADEIETAVASATGLNSLAGSGFEAVPLNTGTGGNLVVTRRYQIPILSGMFQQPKLIPLKYMAQNTLQFNLAPASECIFYQTGYTVNQTAQTTLSVGGASDPSYYVSNVSLVCETLHFDAAYSEAFIEGLKLGVPIKFASFNYYQFPATSSATKTLTISESNRSIKSVFITQNRDPASIHTDSGASFFTTSLAKTTLKEFQFRVGSRMYPSQPIDCLHPNDADSSNGGGEAYVNLAKALNIYGDARLSTTADVINFAGTYGVLEGTAATPRILAKDGTAQPLLNEYDGKFSVVRNIGGYARVVEVESAGKVDVDGVNYGMYGGRCWSGNWNSAQFVMAMNFETSNGLEISGLNAQEQSDIHCMIKYSGSQATEGNVFSYNTWVYYDAMIILLENNVVQLVK